MGVRIVWSPDDTLDWPGPVFPVRKVRLVHPDADLHRLEGLTAVPEKGLREFEIPVSTTVLHAFRLAVGGAVLAAREALREGGAINLGGGFHHAFADRGEGFGLLPDIAVAVLAGGYARRTEDVVAIHVAMVREMIARYGDARGPAGASPQDPPASRWEGGGAP